MKRTNVKLKLKQRLELVRTTVRELTPGQLANVHGGDGGTVVDRASAACATKCCDGGWSFIAPP